MAEQSKDVTSVIVRAMEHADDMESVVIIYKLKRKNDNISGIGWLSNVDDLNTRIGILREGEHGILSYSYGESE